MIAVQKRSGKRHLIHPDGLATFCGRILKRTSWRREDGDSTDCVPCAHAARAERRRETRRQVLARNRRRWEREAARRARAVRESG